MKLIQILGTGCAKCHRLTDVAETAAKELGLAYELQKITRIERFADFGVMITPALVVNGVVKAAGRVPTVAETKQLLV